MESLLIFRRRSRIHLVEVAGQQQVEFPQAAPAAPAQPLGVHALRDVLFGRLTSDCLISAMARAGLSDLGHVSVQFMMVWQR